MDDIRDQLTGHGERLARIEGEMSGVNSKIDNVQATIDKFTAGIGHRVETHGIEITEQKVLLKTIEHKATELKIAVKDHVDNHWKWIGIAVSIMAIFAVLLNVLKK